MAPIEIERAHGSLEDWRFYSVCLLLWCDHMQRANQKSECERCNKCVNHLYRLRLIDLNWLAWLNSVISTWMNDTADMPSRMQHTHTHTNTIQRDRDVLVNRKWLKRTRVWVSELFVGACVRVCASVLNVRFLILTFLSRSQFTVIDVYNCSLPNCLLLFTLIHQTFSLPPPSLLASFTCSRFHLISRSLVTSVNAWWIWCLTVAGNLSL